MTLRRLITPTLCLLFSASAPAAEYIDYFHSDIKVQSNGDLDITETIRLKTEDKVTGRDIHRDFPTRYKDGRGREITVSFDLLSVKRGGHTETFRTSKLSNGIRIHIGDSDVYLNPGIHTYQIHYRNSRQIGFFDNQDELYWNVTGTDRGFEIRKASARLTLPGTAGNLALSGYTGPQGSTEQALHFRRTGADQAFFETTRALASNEGMTIVAGWPKGLVQEPSSAQQRAWFIEDNRTSIIVVGGFLALLLYYLLLRLYKLKKRNNDI